jgi:hypothetical protein
MPYYYRIITIGGRTRGSIDMPSLRDVLLRNDQASSPPVISPRVREAMMRLTESVNSSSPPQVSPRYRDGLVRSSDSSSPPYRSANSPRQEGSPSSQHPVLSPRFNPNASLDQELIYPSTPDKDSKAASEQEEPTTFVNEKQEVAKAEGTANVEPPVTPEPNTTLVLVESRAPAATTEPSTVAEPTPVEQVPKTDETPVKPVDTNNVADESPPTPAVSATPEPTPATETDRSTLRYSYFSERVGSPAEEKRGTSVNFKSSRDMVIPFIIKVDDLAP